MYITRTELETLFPNAFLEVTDALWEQTLPGVDGMIDGYLSQLYAVPVDPVPAALKEIAIAIARYRLEGSLLYDADKDNPLKTRHDYALAQLEKLRRNEIKLLNAAPSEALPEMYSTAAGLEW